MSAAKNVEALNASVDRGAAALDGWAAVKIPSSVFSPEPLRRPMPSPAPYPLACLGHVLAPAAASIQRVIQAPDAVIGGSLLAAASLAAQAHADVVIDGRRLPLSLWLLSVAESGERKSAVDSEAMRAAREFERQLADIFEIESREHVAEMCEYKAREEVATKAARQEHGVGLADRLRDLGPPPPPPLAPRITVADFTSEGLFKLLSTGQPAVGAFTDEAAQVFGGHGFTPETAMRTAGALCKLWDNGSLDRVRSGDGAHFLRGRRLALHLLAQPVIAEKVLSDDLLAGQGFLARCLLAWPVGTAGTRLYVPESLRDNSAMDQLRERLLSLHRRQPPLADGTRQELEPRALNLSTEAFDVWRRFHDEIETNIAPGGDFVEVKAWASKAAEQALRIAGVLTLIETPEANAISVAVMERAATLALWHLQEAVRLVGNAAVPKPIRDAEAVMRWAQEHGFAEIYSSKCLTHGPIRDRGQLLAAMAKLEEAGHVDPLPKGTVIDGKPRQSAWRIRREA